MTLIRWQPFQEVESLRRQFDRMFDDLADYSRDNELSKTAWAPAIALKDTDESLLLRAEVPGY